MVEQIPGTQRQTARHRRTGISGNQETAEVIGFCKYDEDDLYARFILRRGLGSRIVIHQHTPIGTVTTTTFAAVAATQKKVSREHDRGSLAVIVFAFNQRRG